MKVLACGVCRTDLHVVEGELPDPQAAARSGPSGRGDGGAVGEGVEAPAVGDRVGVPWLGGTDGTCPYCRPAWRTSATRPLHRLPARRRLCRVRDGAGRLRASAAGRTTPTSRPRRCCARALIGYRALRLADVDGAWTGRRGWACSGSVLRADRRSRSRSPRPRGLRLHARRARGGSARSSWARSWVGGGDEPPPVRARQRDHLRARRGAGAGRAARGAQGRRGGVRRHPHDADPGVRLRAALGRAGAAQRREPDARRRPRVPRASRRGVGSRPRSRSSRSRRRTRRWCS